MSRAIETARQEADGWKMYVLAGYYLVTGNLSISVAILGVFMIVIGGGIEMTLVTEDMGGNIPIIAGFLPIWGISLALFGTLVYTALWANKMYGRVASN